MHLIKKNFIFSMSLLIVGIICLVSSGLGIMPEGSFASTLLGLGCGLTSAGLACTLVNYMTLKDPKKVEQAEINETDERTTFLREKTSAKVYSLFVYVECVVILVASFLGYQQVVYVLAGLVLVKFIAWALTCTRLAEKY